MIEGNDTEVLDSGDTQADTVTDNSGEDSANLDSQGDLDKIQAEKPTPTNPFATGKEKFKINGEEHEWDWETTKRYAQMGRNAQQATEKAAKTEQSARAAYNEILKAARTDPEGLLRILNPDYVKKSSPSQRDEQAEDADPRDSKIQELESKLDGILKHREAAEVDQARQAIETELDEATKKFPGTEDEFVRDHIKSEYRRHLNSGNYNVSIEDVAFLAHQKLQDKQRMKVQAQKASLDQRRQNAPVNGVSGGGGSSDRKEGESGIEYAMRLAGRM